MHKLEEQDFVAEITPRLLISRSASRTSNQRMRELIARIEEARNADTQTCVA